MKNKKITIYDLIGLMKNGKAPEKIKYDDEIYYYAEESHDYVNLKINKSLLEFVLISHTDWLYEEVEIFSEENDEWEDIEEIDNTGFMSIEDGLELLRKWTNSLIKNQKYLKERIDKK